MSDAMSLWQQTGLLFLLAIPIACVAWTVTHEEVFREPREYCERRSEEGRTVWERKFFYLFTCEYCFSHYVTIFFLILTRYTLLFDDWRGYLIAFFSLVWVANIYMSLFGRVRLGIKHEKVEIKVKEEVLGEANGRSEASGDGKDDKDDKDDKDSKGKTKGKDMMAAR